MSYASVDDARLYDAQNPWGPGDDFYLGLVRAAGDVLDVGTRNPAARAWAEWHGAAFDVSHEGATVRVSYEVLGVEGDLVTFTETTDGGRWARQVDRATLRFLGRPALVAFLAAAGLEVEDCFGDFRRGPLTDTSPEIVMVARRPFVGG